MSEQVSFLASPLAAEDIRVGDYIAPLTEVHQFFLRSCETETSWGGGPQIVTVHVAAVPAYPWLYRVIGIALPFVLVEDKDGDQMLKDVRSTRFARMPRMVGRRALDALLRRRRSELEERREKRTSKASSRVCKTAAMPTDCDERAGPT